MLNKKLLGVILGTALCLSACASDSGEVTGTAAEISAETSVTPNATSFAESSAENDIPEITDPYAAAEKYLKELAESENAVLELRGTKISQTGALAFKYYESPLAEKFGVAEGVQMIPVNVEYYIEYAENSGLESGEKSEYFIVKSDENGLAVVDVFPCDPKEYRGVVKEVLTDENFHGDHYLVELDGGLGTVECNSAVIIGEFEAGERIYIEANGDIYGDPPRLDAAAMLYESEVTGD